MRTLIIPDIHTEHQWVETAIRSLEPEKVVFLGDYFDSFFTDPAGQQRTAEWLKHSLEQPNRVHLLGNHDAHYAYDGPSLLCSGYNPRAKRAIRTVLGDDWGDQLALAHWEGGRLITHAGVHPSLWAGSRAALGAACADARRALIDGAPHALLNCGADRGGTGISGLLWLDWNDSFTPIPGLPQIVGHTQCRSSFRKETGKIEYDAESVVGADGTENWNLDTECAWLGLLTDAGFDLVKNAWHTPRRSRLGTDDAARWDGLL